MLNLTKDIVFFDLETTGLDITKDRIVQIALIKYSPGKSKPEEVNEIINPGIPIPWEAAQVHGITDEIVAGKQTFAEFAPWLYMFIGDADLAGYNSNRFDIPLLAEEFGRAGIEFSLTNRRLVDAQVIFHKMEPRTLKAAYKFYCGQTLENAHDALNDVRATVGVLMGQIEKYKDEQVENEQGVLFSPVTNDIQQLHELCFDPSKVDTTNRFKRDKKGEIIFNFGKHVGQPAKSHEQYLRWIIDSDFTIEVKNICRDLLREMGRKV